MTFDKILENGNLWAVRYDKDNVNALERVLSQWSDAGWLADFFMQNIDDLISYFKITNIEDAIYQTMEKSLIWKNILELDLEISGTF